MKENFGVLSTEQVNNATKNIDTCSTIDKLYLINAEDMNVAKAVNAEIPRIATVVEKCAERCKKGGRIFYIGAGTSGRIGILDASECPPTYGTDPEMVQAIIAGGKDAVFVAVEGAEDDEDLGVAEVANHQMTENDTLIGIAASGRTPFVLGALKAAKSRGVYAVGLSNTSPCAFDDICDDVIAVIVGAEAVTGSTRMKAGTAQKMVLNMISTCVMISLGKLYQNLMVDVSITNEKLFDRGVRIVSAIACADCEESAAVLKECNNNVKLAILVLKYNVTLEIAKCILAESNGILRVAMEKLCEA